ncbi:MAG TPA: hypothetical protein VL017_09025, partial [Devosia sp.]|nr:hypothetical protein [Devosia sp.]
MIRPLIRSTILAGASAVALAVSVPALAAPALAGPALEMLDHGVEAAPSAEGAAAPEMSFGSWGFDPATLDPAVKPGDDFFGYVNGKWVRDNP